MANSVVPTPATTMGHSKLIDPGIKKIWDDAFKQLAPKLAAIVRVESMQGAYEEEAAYAGLSEVRAVSEGETYTQDAVLHTYDTTFTAAKYGVLMPVTYELFNDQFQKVAGKTESAAKAVQRKVEKLAHSMYVNGFSTSYTSYGDAKPLFSVSHPRADGGTAQSNASSTGVTLTEANLETQILLMRNALDDRGNLVDVIPTVLLVPPALEKEAIIITKSELRSDTAENDANVYNMSEYTGGMLKIVSSNYFGAAAGGSDTAWFLMDAGQHKVTWKWRERPSIVKLPDAVGAKNDVWYWKASFRAAYGWSDWRGIVGSKGDGQAYSS